MGVGYQIMKRPGLNKFLLDLSNYYEIVVFGTEDSSVSKFINLNYSLLKILHLNLIHII